MHVFQARLSISFSAIPGPIAHQREDRHDRTAEKETYDELAHLLLTYRVATGRRLPAAGPNVVGTDRAERRKRSASAVSRGSAFGLAVHRLDDAYSKREVAKALEQRLGGALTARDEEQAGLRFHIASEDHTGP